MTFVIDALELVQGTYKFDVALHKLDGFPYDYHRLLYSFRVKSRTQDVGHLPPAPHLEVLRRGIIQGSGQEVTSSGFRP